jgi:hypothetical protein
MLRGKYPDEVHFFYLPLAYRYVKKSSDNKENNSRRCAKIMSSIGVFLLPQASYCAYKATFGRLSQQG